MKHHFMTSLELLELHKPVETLKALLKVSFYLFDSVLFTFSWNKNRVVGHKYVALVCRLAASQFSLRIKKAAYITQGL